MSAPGGDAPGPPTLGDGLRFACGVLTVLPAGPVRWDRATARLGMTCAPVAGLAVGFAAMAVALVLLELGLGPLPTAVAAVAVPAVLTRALHLDGLADVADGLGSRLPPGEARAVMKRSDAGPFGVVTLVLVLLAQTAALHELFHHGRWPGPVAALLAAVTARAALTWACRRGVPAATGEGLGAAVAQSVPVPAAVGVAGGVAALAAALGALSGAHPATGAVAGVSAVVLALSGAELLLRHCRRRLGGVTGDVLGAVAETAATVALSVLTLTA